MQRIVRLKTGVQHYAWGDPQFIPSLMGIKNKCEKPFAELWMGAHPDLPSEVLLDRTRTPLDKFIANAPSDFLGAPVARRFDNRLPFLLKVLSAAKPLSIQAHPCREKAISGFAREQAAGIPLNSPRRNYKDENHKPELFAALTEFHGLRGFRPLAEVATVLDETPELGAWAERAGVSAYDLEHLYATFMKLTQNEVDAVLDPVMHRLEEESAKRELTRNDREYWLLEADREFSTEGHRDRGLFSVFLLNLVRLSPGEAMFLPAGVLHAYLEGAGVEIMANSNNVLRGGLTSKHIDIGELLDNVTFEARKTEVLKPNSSNRPYEFRYHSPAEEFELRFVQLPEGGLYECNDSHFIEIAFAVEGQSRIYAQDQQLEFIRGETILIPAGVPYRVETMGPAMFYKATVPAAQKLELE